MTHSYKLLFHLSFHHHIYAIINSCPPAIKSQLENQIKTALCKIKTNPTCGARFKYITNKKLEGAIRKIYVGGRKGHRLIYIYNSKKYLIIPVHLTSELRCDIDYKKPYWEKIADAIYDDYINKNYDKFVNWK